MSDRLGEGSEPTRRESPSSDLLEGLLEPGVAGLAAALDWGCDALAPAERALVAGAVESRQREFAGGRVLVRRLLEARGIRDFPLLRDADRVPIWPLGVVGCISHTHDLAVAILSAGEPWAGLGIDVEPDEPVERGIERIVCRGPEKAWLEAAPDPEERGRRCKMIFSVKEAVYKAFFPRTRTFWSFQDVTVEIDPSQGRFEARLPPSADRDRIEGRLARRSGWLLATVHVDRAG
ncbi:MAG: 4'-phosphopantetheinyl transferase family protein [bacterium]